ncbi:MAG: triosephosphate isomerase [Candidatus Omnitrophota bacterium]|jgi:triosephosphate isomerase
MRKKIIAGNWKLNKTLNESIQLVTLLKRNFNVDNGVEIIVCPVYTALASVNEIANESPIKVGSQNIYWEESGAFTGEVSGSLLKDAGCTYAIIGHSERRQFFGETEASVNQRILAADKNNLIPIVCVGELLEERESNQTEAVIDKQIRGAFKEISADIAAKAVIAYEPVWAIGTGKVATPEQAQETHAFIRKLMQELYGEAIAAKVAILYGGSVKPGNAAEILGQADVDGALVGGASLKVEDFSAIIQAAEGVKVS